MVYRLILLNIPVCKSPLSVSMLYATNFLFQHNLSCFLQVIHV